jgi:hypothetical protein
MKWKDYFEDLVIDGIILLKSILHQIWYEHVDCIRMVQGGVQCTATVNLGCGVGTQNFRIPTPKFLKFRPDSFIKAQYVSITVNLEDISSSPRESSGYFLDL